MPDVDRREEKFVASEPMSCCLLVLFKEEGRKVPRELFFGRRRPSLKRVGRKMLNLLEQAEEEFGTEIENHFALGPFSGFGFPDLMNRRGLNSARFCKNLRPIDWIQTIPSDDP